MRQAEKTGFAHWVAAGLLVTGLAIPQISAANHPVKVEGDVDFDGDGRVGIAEDMDGPAGDPQGLTFGTIAGCLGAMNGAINNNGICLFVTSGSFAETVTITGNVTLEAAPGVTANIEAFLAPADPRLQEFPAAAMNPSNLQGQPGIIINAPANRAVYIKGVRVTNWTDGIRVMGASNVVLEDVTVTNNVNTGVNVLGTAVVTIANSRILSTGKRVNPNTGDFPTMNMPQPGIGVVAANGTNVTISGTLISDTFGPATQGVQGVNNNANRNTVTNVNFRNRLPSMGTGN